MKRIEIKKLIDLDSFYEEVQEIAKQCNCTHLEAVEEYGRLHSVDFDLLAQIVKISRGRFRSTIEQECEQLRLIKA